MRRAISNFKTPSASRRTVGLRPAPSVRAVDQNARVIACLRIPNFPWQVEVARKPELQDRSAIVAGRAIDLAEELTNSDSDSLSVHVVLAASPDLADAMPGMPLTEAMSRHRGVLLIEADTPLYALVFDEIIENLEHLVPDIEATAPGLAYVGIWGLEGLYGDDAHVVRLLASAVDSFDLRIGVGLEHEIIPFTVRYWHGNNLTYFGIRSKRGGRALNSQVRPFASEL